MKKSWLMGVLLIIILLTFGCTVVKTAPSPSAPLTSLEILTLEQDLTVLQTQLIAP